MAFTRNHLYAISDRQTSDFAKALSHSARLLIIRKLQKEGPLTVGRIAKLHPISLQAISQHLSILRKSKLVDCWEKYPYTFYCMNAKNLKKAKKCMISFLGSI